MLTAADSPSAAQPFSTVAVEPPITLGRFLKLAGLVGTGGDAKLLIAAARVSVNGQVETRRGRKLWPGDTVEGQGFALRVSSAHGDDAERSSTQPMGDTQ